MSEVRRLPSLYVGDRVQYVALHGDPLGPETIEDAHGTVVGFSGLNYEVHWDAPAGLTDTYPRNALRLIASVLPPSRDPETIEGWLDG